MKNPFARDFNRRKFLSSVGKGFVMMTLSSATVASLNIYTTVWELDRFYDVAARIAKNGLPKL